MPAAEVASLETQTLSDIVRLPADVRALLDDGERVDFQFGHRWYANLVQTVFHDGPSPALHVLRRAGRPVAALPVAVHRQRTGNSVRALGNYYTSLFSPALAQDVQASDLAVLLRAVRTSHAPLRSLTLAPMAPESPAFALLEEGLKLAGFAAYRFFCFGNWFLPVAVTSAQYLSTRPGEVRSTLRRMGRKFADAGGQLEVCATPADAAAGIPEFEEVYRRSWKRPEPYPGFIPGLARVCADRGWLRLGLARLGGRPIAAQLWVVANGKAAIYKLAYDTEHRRLSPGTLLTAALMQHVIDHDRVAEVDYLTGDDAYKRDWMSHRRERWGLVAYDPRSLGGLWGLTREVTGRAARPVLSRIKALRGSPQRA